MLALVKYSESARDACGKWNDAEQEQAETATLVVKVINMRILLFYEILELVFTAANILFIGILREKSGDISRM